MAESTDELADQLECTAAVLEETPEAVIVSNLGNASYILASVANRDRNFYLWGSMGVTTPVGFGLALSTDEYVTVFDGDGSFIMSLGVIATLGRYDPMNLVVVVWDNGQYKTTGGQPTHSKTVDFVAAVRSCGLKATHVATSDGFVDAYRDAVSHDGTAVVVCEVEPVEPQGRPPLDSTHLKRRFRAALGTDE
jgi:thiamine pyrophosphate-dependent acetolactate synthase large subunit-like protein